MRRFPPAVSTTKTLENNASATVRRYDRATVDLPAQYAIAGEPDWRPSTIEVLGGGGVRLQTQEDVAAGTVVTLRFDIEGTPITATARIAMSLFDEARSHFVHGAAFTAIDPEQQNTIQLRVVALQNDKA